MMRKIIYLIFVLPLFARAQNPAAFSGFLIEGNIRGLADRSSVYLVDPNNPADTLARGTTKTGAFSLTGHVTEPNIYELNFAGINKKIPIFFGKDHVKIEGTIDDLKALKITGSASNDDFVEFQKTFSPYFARLNALSQQAGAQPSGASSDSITKAYASTVLQIQTELDGFLAKKQNSYVSPFILVVTAQLSEDVFLLERRYKAFSPEVQNSFYGKYLKDQIETGKVGAIGTDALDFTQSDTTGKLISLSSFKGKYVLVDFWASWCKPCRMENPNVVATYGKFRNKNFTVLGISLDRARDPWIKAIKEDNLSWTQVSDLKFWNNEVAVKYKIQSIPQNLLIGPDGKIVGKNLRGPELEAKLCELLGCN